MSATALGTSDPALDAHLSEGERTILEWAEGCAEGALAPIAERHHGAGLDRPLLTALAEHGMLERLFGDEAGPAALELCLIREGLARISPAAETAFAVQGLGFYPILRWGSRELVERWLPDVAAGRIAAGFALTEPGAGSDVGGVALRAERDGDGFRLTGEKAWISNAPEAEIYTVFARTSEGSGSRGLTAFAVESGVEGLGGEPIELISPHPIGRLTFRGAWVPETNLLGELDAGMAVAMSTLDLFRPSVGAFAVGMARAALDLAVAHAAGREAFGAPLARLQAVSHPLAEVATRIQAARLLVHQAASAYDQGVRPVTQLAAMAKLMATEVAQRAVDVAVQVHGASALQRGHPLEHLYRDVRAPRIYEGASELQREIIARSLFSASARSGR